MYIFQWNLLLPAPLPSPSTSKKSPPWAALGQEDHGSLSHCPQGRNI